MTLSATYSTGWLSWNGDPFPNTSYDKFIDYFSQVLQYNEGSGSVNLYMAHGGSNFGWWTGVRPLTRLYWELDALAGWHLGDFPGWGLRLGAMWPVTVDNFTPEGESMRNSSLKE